MRLWHARVRRLRLSRECHDFINPDLQAHLVNFLKECAGRNANHFQILVGQLGVEEMLVIQRVLNDSKQ